MVESCHKRVACTPVHEGEPQNRKTWNKHEQTISRPSLPGARTLLGAPGHTTRSKKLLGTKGIVTRSKDVLGWRPFNARVSSFTLCLGSRHKPERHMLVHLCGPGLFLRDCMLFDVMLFVSLCAHGILYDFVGDFVEVDDFWKV